MVIKKLIKIYKSLIPFYIKAIETKEVSNMLQYGLCYAIYNLPSEVYSSYTEFSRLCERDNGYYYNLIKKNSLYLFPIYSINRSIKLSIKPRLDFMKKEIISLNKLLEKGYTHV